MRLRISPRNMLTSNKDGESFLPLGEYTSKKRLTRKDLRFIQRQSAKRNRKKGIWGTLGSWDHQPFLLKGTLLCSSHGSVASSVAHSGESTLQEIQAIREGRPQYLNQPGQPDSEPVIERYLSLEQATLPDCGQGFTADEIPMLRLTVFVAADEGALVFYQRMSKKKKGDMLADPTDTSIEYLLPEPTDDQHQCHQRDRLHYRIPAYPATGLVLSEEGGALPPRLSTQTDDDIAATKLVLKVLIFKRQNSTSADILRRVADRVGLVKHNLLLWQNQQQGYYFTDVTAEDIDFDRKTLLLLHGTFSSTRGTYGNLFEKPVAGSNQVFLEQLLAQTDFEQILAFDHDTLFSTLEQNAAQLQDILGKRCFSQPVTALGFSRGALLLKYLAVHCPNLNIQHGVTVAAANEVGYLTLPRTLATFCSAMRLLTLGSAPLTMLNALAQHSERALQQLPGLQMMSKLNTENQALRAQGPLTTTLVTVSGTFDSSLIREQRLLRRIGARTLHALISALLVSWRHDWVVTETAQQIIAPCQPHPVKQPTQVKSRHTSYFGQQLSESDLFNALYP
ncbi:DUF7379 domain-containing protein [Alkalimonas mucilaginosa]|uniref:DUF7379 domain-containing protein n=1 Tax=Alkalimonas mucilaginosa TaxID=3057676 RepID=A0ABU7JKU4_9GAMM|nr:hypothetical protein [Alkalimonas sp. MEB004]MEE2025735.1 hypothetical protein [Alkalimonas sp. MEB004]